MCPKRMLTRLPCRQNPAINDEWSQLDSAGAVICKGEYCDHGVQRAAASMTRLLAEQTLLLSGSYQRARYIAQE